MTEEEMERRGDEAVERLAKALGRPPARRLTDEERREFWAEQARIDEELARRYGPPLTKEEIEAHLTGQARVAGGRGSGPTDTDADAA